MVALSQVKSIFVNIFGGIARCDHIAEAVVAGVKAVGGNAAIKPLVIRLEGRWDGMGWDDVQHMMGPWGLVGICWDISPNNSGMNWDDVFFFLFLESSWICRYQR